MLIVSIVFVDLEFVYSVLVCIEFVIERQTLDNTYHRETDTKHDKP